MLAGGNKGSVAWVWQRRPFTITTRVGNRLSLAGAG
jgi:hypothetical protein